MQAHTCIPILSSSVFICMPLTMFVMQPLMKKIMYMYSLDHTEYWSCTYIHVVCKGERRVIVVQGTPGLPYFPFAKVIAITKIVC